MVMGKGLLSLFAFEGLGFCPPPPVTLITDAGFLGEKEAHSEGNAGKHEGKGQEGLLVKDVGESGQAIEQLVNERHSLHAGSLYFRHCVDRIIGRLSTQRMPCSHAFAPISLALSGRMPKVTTQLLHLDLDTK